MVVLDKKLLERLTSRKVPLEELQDMEKRCFLSTFTYQDAFDLGTYIRNAVKENFPEKPVAIDISLPNGHCLFRTVTYGGSALDNDFWIQRKKKTALRFGHSSFYMGCKKGDKTPEEKFFVDSKEYAFHGGAVLIQSERSDYPYACLTISGLKQEEDHLMAVSSLIAFANESLEEDLNLD
ncbi:AAC_HP2_G0003120.mRNA.1.CDS.1 [Saccharomyces cerevisiae]|nr:AAC_HP2_G0003120.mRNA.1.CDS.1 [Saccharomyces cerevisiae]CAI6395354.1 AAC_HP1_G0003260.mRNA.1.CDS.1 [Saccharomyces cerevisiae]CAI6396522.1 AAC_HP2_G0003120.mRNA.1.CDS.1 [Saccharomyces cerevisiae]CAI6496386.1 AAC_collapsed_G0003290.mRNA.1.CDS.1 [Saccharomyces cerevisiae]